MTTPSSPRIRFNCPRCTQRVEFGTEHAGHRRACPHCQFELLVPTAGASGANFFDDLFGDEPETRNRPVETTSSAPANSQVSLKVSTDSPERTAQLDSAPAHPAPPAPLAASAPSAEATTVGKPESSATHPAARFEDLDVAALSQSPAGPLHQLPPEQLRYLDVTQQLPPTGRDPFASGETSVPEVAEVEHEDVFGLSDLDQIPQDKPPGIDSEDDFPLDVGFDQATPFRQSFSPSSDDDPLELEPDDKDDPLSLDNLTGAPRMQFGSSGTTDGDPFADDPDAPLRIDGISEQVNPDSLFAIRCHVCDSRIMIGPQYAGTQITCPDCFTRIDVPKEAEPPKPTKSWNTTVRSAEPESSLDLSKRDDELKLAPADQLPDEYGLAPIDEDLLRPKPTSDLVLDPEARAELEGSKPTGAAGPVRTGRNRSDASNQSESAAANVSANTSGSSMPSGSRTQAQGTANAANSAANKKPIDKQQYRPSAARPENTIPTTEEKHRDQQFPIELHELWTDRPKMSQWTTRLFSDPELWLRAGGAALLLAVSYWLGGMMVATIFSDANEAQKFIVVLGLGLFGVIALVGAVWFTVMVLSLVFQLGTEKYARFTLWPGFGLGEWGGAALYVAFSGWLSSLPGVLLGIMFMLAFDSPLAFVLPVAVSVLLLQPLILSHAYYNGSAWQVFSADMVRAVSTHDPDWLRFVPGSVLGLVGVALGFVLMLVPGFLVALIAAAIQIMSLLLFYSTTGLYCHLMAEKVEQKREQTGKK